MTDKEFKRLTRAQLIDIIYQLQLQIDTLNEQIQNLETALQDKRLRIDNAGNIAEAALAINDCFLSAQKAAEQYLDEIKAIRADTETAREKILAEARAKAERLVLEAKNTHGDYDAAVEAIMKEYGQDHSNNG